MGSSDVLRKTTGGSGDAAPTAVRLRRVSGSVLAAPAAVVLAVVPKVVSMLGATSTAGGDPADARAGHRVSVAAAERMLRSDILRGAHLSVGDRPGDRHRRRAHPDRRTDCARRCQAADQRGVVCVVLACRSPAAAGRLVAGHGVFGRPGGVHLPAGGSRPHATAVAHVARGRRRCICV